MSRTKFTPAQRIKTNADIVFCLDATASMEPCFEGVRNGLYGFVEGLKSAADVDYRLRLIAYRDRHDPDCRVPWQINSFTNSVEDFRAQLAAVTPKGGGGLPESTLDAVYLAIKSDWRLHKTHKTIVLMTDADTHPTLHHSTYNLPDNNIYRVIQEFQSLRHVMLFMVLPRYPLYEQLEKSMKAADRKIVANFVPPDEDRYKGLRGVAWQPLMKLLGQTVSQTSLYID
jgi:hypothetical protein